MANPNTVKISTPEDKRKMTGILQAIDAVLDQCKETVRRTSHNILCWLKSTRPQSSYPKPFSLVHHDSTTKKYHWDGPTAQGRALSPLIQGHSKSRESSSDGYSSEDDAAGDEYQKEDEDKEGEEIEAKGSNDDNYTDDNNNEDHTDNELNDSTQETAYYNTITSPISDQLLELIFTLNLGLCTEHLTNGQPTSTVLGYFSGILGFSVTSGRYLPARSYIPYLSGLVYIQRLLFLKQALPLRSYPALGIERRPRVKLLERLEKTRERYIVHGSQSAMEEFISLRAYGRVVARSDTPSVVFRWSDDGRTLSWGRGVDISMDQFRQLPYNYWQPPWPKVGVGRVCKEWEAQGYIRTTRDEHRPDNSNHPRAPQHLSGTTTRTRPTKSGSVSL
ncbi:hypothetical protein S7711_09670 [Stachybotrys chartarum IBT 7711]|uniref:Uncharacterized protein n=1 Tax=Stachybotrys chartarum (strain CBS 109288 / IBT 7711) TaxID=1280523 RepID=A0A084BBF1_STACB|nr:hypothetical protein S7711_09670 [Stachybotrys chartarum IBT 7711]